MRPDQRFNLLLVLTVALLVLSACVCLLGVFLVGGLGWALLVGGAAGVALALTALPT